MAIVYNNQNSLVSHPELTLGEGSKNRSNRTKHIKKAVNKREHSPTVITTSIIF